MFGWTEGDNTGERGNPLILYTGEFGQFIFLLPADGASTGNNVDHFGLQVSTCEEIEDIVDRAKKRQASDERVQCHRHPLAYHARTGARVHAHQRVHRVQTAADDRAAEHHASRIIMSDSDVLFERDGHVGLITLNRPERLNAITTAMIAQLSEVLLRADQERNVRVIILTGAGRGFCSGLDLQAVADGSMGVGEGGSTTGVVSIAEHPPFVLRRIDTPVICALNGPASGYGMDLALGCDFIIASEQATFVSPVKRSLVPESGGTWLLPRLIGWQKACEVVMLARRLDAREIERLGMANKVVAPDELMAEARRWADEVAANPPLAVAAAKRGMRFALDSTFEANAHFLMAELRQLMRTADFQEGVQSFLEKRPATYEGR